MSTCHANSPADALTRIEMMVMMGPTDVPLAAVREQIRSSIDLVVQVVRRPDGTRGISAVHEVVDPRPVRDRAAASAGAESVTTALTDGGLLIGRPTRAPRAVGVEPIGLDWVGR